ncbi:MAG: DNA polymerase III subunit gamma/tau [Candidatus Makaraimicrobium thalassicum]|nr:MAG: DNA polymerase III subunit gamma/tau [Candidatus Omnitrophota bacterium]
MSYQVLARKYRPQTFDDVVGQEIITRTLRNSVLNGRIANAYIFCGPRGVGKTSIARLLSKTLNCEKPPDKSPCNECISCREITQGNNIDVLEIDGASNNGVDEIRTLRENVKFSPSRAKFKIYIIDEVHMLSQGAFNALLKTLEEPPSHVKFMFATTEPHKVLPTIMSRCQRFDFRKIPPKMIYKRILAIARKEKVNVDEKAALLIARSADGSLRDSLVILDQMISFSGKTILPDDVMELLGMVHRDKIFGLSDAVIENDPGRAAGILDEMITGGKDPIFIVNSVIEHYRDLMILKTTGDPTFDMAFTGDELEKLKAQHAKLSLEEILYILQNLTHCLTLMKGVVFTRAPLEITLIRLTRRGSMLSLPQILARLQKMEEDGGETGEALSAGPLCPEATEQGGPEADHRQRNFGGEINDNGSQGPDLDAAKFHWKAVLNYVRNKKMSVFTFLSAAKPVEFGEDKVVIGFGKDHSFNKEALETADNRGIIEEAVNKVTGNSPRVEFTLLEFLGESARNSGDDAGKRAKAKEVINPVIERAMDVFGGHVVRDFMEDQK